MPRVDTRNAYARDMYRSGDGRHIPRPAGRPLLAMRRASMTRSPLADARTARREPGESTTLRDARCPARYPDDDIGGTAFPPPASTGVAAGFSAIFGHNMRAWLCGSASWRTSVARAAPRSFLPAGADGGSAAQWPALLLLALPRFRRHARRFPAGSLLFTSPAVRAEVRRLRACAFSPCCRASRRRHKIAGAPRGLPSMSKNTIIKKSSLNAEDATPLSFLDCAWARFSACFSAFFFAHAG